jgi:hypothetical protein
LGFGHGVFQWGGGLPPEKFDSGPLRRPATRRKGDRDRLAR